jgi:protein SCO1/2
VAWRNRARSRPRLAALGVALGMVALTACSGTGHMSNDMSGMNMSSTAQDLVNRPVSQYAGFGLTPPQPRPNFVLTDEAGKSFSFGARTQGRPTLLFFGYTHCPDDCPTTMADIHLALKQVPAAVRAKTLVVFVTTDPKRDTAKRIHQWLSEFDGGLPKANWIGLRGTRAQLDVAQAAAHVLIAQDNGETHSLSVLLYGPDDYAHVSFALTNTESQEMVHDLPMVAAGR